MCVTFSHINTKRNEQFIKTDYHTKLNTLTKLNDIIYNIGNLFPSKETSAKLCLRDILLGHSSVKNMGLGINETNYFVILLM